MHALVLSRVMSSKVLRMAIQCEYFFLIRRKNSGCMLEIRWCELSCTRSICTLKSDQWISIYWAKFELECLLLVFIYSNSKLKSLAKTRTLNAGTSELIPKKKEKVKLELEIETCIKFQTLHSPFYLFLIKLFTKLPFWLLWSLLFLMKPSDALQNGLF